MDHPFILGVCQHLSFYIVFTSIFQFFGQNPLSSITVLFYIFCVSPIQIWETPNYYYYYFKIGVLFQNKNLCWWCVPRRDILFCLFTCPGSTNVICGHFGTTFLKNVDILSDLASNILPEGLLFKPEGLLSNLEYSSRPPVPASEAFARRACQQST